MKTVSVDEMSAQFNTYLQASEKGPVVVTRDGKAVAVLLAVGNEDELERLELSYSSRLQTILQDARQRIHVGKGIPHEAFWQEMALPQPGSEGAANTEPSKPAE